MAEEKKSLVEEFKEFIDKGNAMDMAVGVTVGGAFTAIVTALTTDIINPLITLLTGGVAGEDGVAIPLTIAGFNVGSFISAIINFLLIALVVFLLVKAINKMKEAGSSVLKKEEEGEAEPEMDPPTCPFCLVRRAMASLVRAQAIFQPVRTLALSPCVKPALPWLTTNRRSSPSTSVVLWAVRARRIPANCSIPATNPRGNPMRRLSWQLMAL